MIGVVFVSPELTHHISVTYILPKVVRNIFKIYDSKGVYALNPLIICSTCTATDPLEKSPESIGIGCVPNLLIFWVTAKLAIFQ